MVPSTVDWSGEPPGRLTSAVRHLGASLFVAISVFFLVTFAATTLSGNARSALLFVVVLLVGGPASLLYLWYGLQFGEESAKQRLRQHLPNLRLRWLTLATPVGVLVLLSIGAVPWPLPVYAVVGIVVWTVTATGRLGGTLDTDAGTLVREHDQRDVEHDLSGLKSFRSLRLGPYVVCWLRHTRGNTLDEPFGVVFPVDAFDEIRPALVELRDRNAGETRNLTTDRAILVTIGLLFVAVAVAVALEFAGPQQANGFGWILAAWGLLFVLLAWVA